MIAKLFISAFIWFLKHQNMTRCSTYDMDDFPEIPYNHQSRCFNCRVWDVIDFLDDYKSL